jgi:hypothetical protein
MTIKQAITQSVWEQMDMTVWQKEGSGSDRTLIVMTVKGLGGSDLWGRPAVRTAGRSFLTAPAPHDAQSPPDHDSEQKTTSRRSALPTEGHPLWGRPATRAVDRSFVTSQTPHGARLPPDRESEISITYRQTAQTLVHNLFAPRCTSGLENAWDLEDLDNWHRLIMRIGDLGDTEDFTSHRHFLRDLLRHPPPGRLRRGRATMSRNSLPSSMRTHLSRGAFPEACRWRHSHSRGRITVCRAGRASDIKIVIHQPAVARTIRGNSTWTTARLRRSLRNIPTSARSCALRHKGFLVAESTILSNLCQGTIHLDSNSPLPGTFRIRLMVGSVPDRSLYVENSLSTDSLLRDLDIRSEVWEVSIDSIPVRDRGAHLSAFYIADRSVVSLTRRTPPSLESNRLLWVEPDMVEDKQDECHTREASHLDAANDAQSSGLQTAVCTVAPRSACEAALLNTANASPACTPAAPVIPIRDTLPADPSIASRTVVPNAIAWTLSPASTSSQALTVTPTASEAGAEKTALLPHRPTFFKEVQPGTRATCAHTEVFIYHTDSSFSLLYLDEKATLHLSSWLEARDVSVQATATPNGVTLRLFVRGRGGGKAATKKKDRFKDPPLTARSKGKRHAKLDDLMGTIFGEQSCVASSGEEAIQLASDFLSLLGIKYNKAVSATPQVSNSKTMVTIQMGITKKKGACHLEWHWTTGTITSKGAEGDRNKFLELFLRDPEIKLTTLTKEVSIWRKTIIKEQERIAFNLDALDLAREEADKEVETPEVEDSGSSSPLPEPVEDHLLAGILCLQCLITGATVHCKECNLLMCDPCCSLTHRTPGRHAKDLFSLFPKEGRELLQTSGHPCIGTPIARDFMCPHTNQIKTFIGVVTARQDDWVFNHFEDGDSDHSYTKDVPRAHQKFLTHVEAQPQLLACCLTEPFTRARKSSMALAGSVLAPVHRWSMPPMGRPGQEQKGDPHNHNVEWGPRVSTLNPTSLSETLRLKFGQRIRWSHETVSLLQRIVDFAAQLMSCAVSTRALFTEITFEQVCKLPPSGQDDGRLHGDMMEEVMLFCETHPSPTPLDAPNGARNGEVPCLSYPAVPPPKPVAGISSVQSLGGHRADVVEHKLQSFKTPPPRVSFHRRNDAATPTTLVHQVSTGSPVILPPGASTGRSAQERGWNARSTLTMTHSPSLVTTGRLHQVSGVIPAKASPPPRDMDTRPGGSPEGLQHDRSCSGCNTHLVPNAVACPKCGLRVVQRSLCRDCSLAGPVSVHCTFCSMETPPQYRSFETCAFCTVKKESRAGPHCEGCGNRRDHKRLKSDHQTVELENRPFRLLSSDEMTALLDPRTARKSPTVPTDLLEHRQPGSQTVSTQPLVNPVLKVEPAAPPSNQNGPSDTSWMQPVEIGDSDEIAPVMESVNSRIPRWVQAEGSQFSVTCPIARVTHRGGICLKRTLASIPKLDNLVTKAISLLGSYEDALHLTIRKLDGRAIQDALDGPMERKTIVLVLQGNAILSLRALRPEGMVQINSTVVSPGQAVCIPGADMEEGVKVFIEAYDDEQVITIEARSVLHCTEAAKPCENVRCTFGEACAFSHKAELALC